MPKMDLTKTRILDLTIPRGKMISKRQPLGDITSTEYSPEDSDSGVEYTPIDRREPLLCMEQTEIEIINDSTELNRMHQQGRYSISMPTKSQIVSSDQQMNTDCRIITNLRNLERTTTPRFDYLARYQRDITPEMRKIITTWMLEVCDEQKVEEQVFPLAVNFMDRFLCTTQIGRTQIQLVAVTCLLLASKIRSCNHLSVDLLCVYTDNSVNAKQVKTTEMLILSALQWNLCGVTAFDYIDHILQRVSWGKTNPHIRTHAITLMTVTYTEPLGITISPAIIASACICAASRGLKIPAALFSLNDVCRLVMCDYLQVELTIRNIEYIVYKETAARQFLEIQSTKCMDDGYNMDPVLEISPDTPPDSRSVRF